LVKTPICLYSGVHSTLASENIQASE